MILVLGKLSTILDFASVPSAMSIATGGGSILLEKQSPTAAAANGYLADAMASKGSGKSGWIPLLPKLQPSRCNGSSSSMLALKQPKSMEATERWQMYVGAKWRRNLSLIYLCSGSTEIGGEKDESMH